MYMYVSNTGSILPGALLEVCVEFILYMYVSNTGSICPELF